MKEDKVISYLEKVFNYSFQEFNINLLYHN